MTTTAAAVIFDRPENSSLGQPGKTVEYRDEHGHTLAYLDYSEDGQTARCNVFDPATSRSRQYEWRPVARAAQIVTNHLNRLGYAADENPREIEESESLKMTMAEALGVDPAVIDAAQALTPAEPVAVGTMGPFPEPPAPVNIPVLPTPAEHDEWLRDVTPAPEPGAWDSPAVRAAVAETIAPQLQQDDAPEFASVSDAADGILGAPEDEIIRHWRDVRGTVWQFHLRSICPPAETAAALRSFVADVNSSPARGGRTMNSERRFYCWGPEGWNVGYAIILPA